MRQQLDGLRVGDGLPDPRGRAADARRRRSRPTASRSSPRSTSRRGAWEQYELPYTIVRPFNCVGIGERRAVRDTDVMSGNVKLALSHVVPGPRPQGPQGPGPAAHPGRRRPGPPLHLRRRPGPRHPPRDGVAGGASTTTSTSRPRRPRRSSSWPRRSGARSTPTAGRSATSATRRSSTTSSCASRTSARRATCSASRRRRRSTQMLDEVIPWIRAESEAGRL